MQRSPQQLLDQVAQLERGYAALEQQLADAAAAHADPQAYQQLSRELADLRDLVADYRTYQRLEREAAEADGVSTSRARTDPE